MTTTAPSPITIRPCSSATNTPLVISAVRGNAYFAKKDFDRAIADYDAALKDNPKNAWTLFARGVAKKKKGGNAGGDADIAAAKTIQADIAESAARRGIK